jgi:hypothetical protein
LCADRRNVVHECSRGGGTVLDLILGSMRVLFHEAAFQRALPSEFSQLP